MRFLALGAFIFLMGSQIQGAFASGCGGPEYRRRDAVVQSSYPFSEFAKGHNITLVVTLAGTQQAKILLNFPLFEDPQHPKYYWHNLDFYGAIPRTLTVPELEAFLTAPETKIEIVKDRFEVECSQEEEPDAFAENIRIEVAYQGKKLEFRTTYDPYGNQQ